MGLSCWHLGPTWRGPRPGASFPLQLSPTAVDAGPLSTRQKQGGKGQGEGGEEEGKEGAGEGGGREGKVHAVEFLEIKAPKWGSRHTG